MPNRNLLQVRHETKKVCFLQEPVWAIIDQLGSEPYTLIRPIDSYVIGNRIYLNSTASTTGSWSWNAYTSYTGNTP